MSEKANYHLDNLFKQCDRDYVKLFQIVSDYLSKNSDFYKNDNYKTILVKSFLKKDQIQSSCPVLPISPMDKNGVSNNAKNESNVTVNDSCSDKTSVGHRVLVEATQNEHSFNTNEASNDMFEVDETMDKLDLHNKESKSGPGDNTKTNSQSKSNNQLNRSILTDDEDEADFIPETQCELTKSDEGMEEDDDEYIQVQPETNSYSAPIDQSQNVLRNYNYSLLVGIDATKNNKSNDSINLTTSFAENVSKMDDNDSEMSALKWNESTDKSTLLQKSRTLNGSSSTPINKDRDTSVTPDLDFILEKNSGDANIGNNSADRTQTSSTPEFLSAKSFASSKEGAEDKQPKNLNEKVSDEKIDTDIIESASQGKKTVDSDKLFNLKERGESDKVDKRDKLDEPDKYSEDDNKAENNKPNAVKSQNARDKQDEEEEADFYGACTQVFQHNEKEKQVQEKSDKNVPSKNKTEDFYDMLTQIVPEEENDPQKINNIMPPPAFHKKFAYKKPPMLPSAPNKKTIYDMATQEFTPPDGDSAMSNIDTNKRNSDTSPTRASKSGNDGDIYAMNTQLLEELPTQKATAKPNGDEKRTTTRNTLTIDIEQTQIGNKSGDDDDDNIYAMATQVLPESSSKKAIADRITPTSDFDQSQPETPAFCIVKHITNDKIRQSNEKWIEKEQKRQTNYKWLFDDSSDEDDKETSGNIKTEDKNPKIGTETRDNRSKRRQSDVPPHIATKRTRSSAKDSTSGAPSNEDHSEILKRSVSVVVVPLEKQKRAKDRDEIHEKVPAKDDKAAKERERDKQKRLEHQKHKEEITEKNTSNRRTTRQKEADKVIASTFDTVKVEEPKHTSSSKRDKTPTVKAQHSGGIAIKQEPVTPSARIERSRRRTSSNNSSDSISTRRSSRVAHSTSPFKGKYQVMFTKIDSSLILYEAIVTKLGGDVTEIPKFSTVLVTEKRIMRTWKVLCAFAKGIPIVSTKWITESLKAKKFLKPEEFLLRDPDVEKRYSFKLKNSMEKARATSIFKGYAFYVTANVKPTPSELMDIIKCGGGTCLLKHSDKPNDTSNVYLVSCSEDKKLWDKYRSFHKNLQVINTEAIMLSVIRQKIAIAGNILSK